MKLTSKRQVTFPARVLEELGVEAGDRLELIDTPEGYLLRARRLDASRLAPLRDSLQAPLRRKVSRQEAVFDLDAFRDQPHDPSLRD